MSKKNIKQCDICKEEEAKSIVFNALIIIVILALNMSNKRIKILNIKKGKIDYFIPINIWCPDHEKDAIKFFCVDEKGNKFLHIYI